MKKLLSGVLLVCMVLSFSACGSAAPAEPSVAEQMYEKYGSIINNLEAGEYEKVLEEVTSMMPEPEEKVIEITPDNLFDYYDLKFDESQINRDAQGNVTNIWFTKNFRYYLKEEYRSLLIADSSNVSIGVTADCVLKKVESINWETGDMTLSEENYDDIASVIKNDYNNLNTDFSSTFSGNITLFNGDISALGYGAFFLHKDTWGQAWWQGTIESKDPDSDYYVFVPENIQIVRVEGTITLKG